MEITEDKQDKRCSSGLYQNRNSLYPITYSEYRAIADHLCKPFSNNVMNLICILKSVRSQTIFQMHCKLTFCWVLFSFLLQGCIKTCTLKQWSQNNRLDLRLWTLMHAHTSKIQQRNICWRSGSRRTHLLASSIGAKNPTKILLAFIPCVRRFSTQRAEWSLQTTICCLSLINSSENNVLDVKSISV